MRYRKKPVVIEASQWFKPGDHEKVIHPVPANVEINMDGWRAEISGGLVDKLALGAIQTDEGWHIVKPGDWIIRGVKGEHYPCKPDVFALTYEPAE